MKNQLLSFLANLNLISKEQASGDLTVLTDKQKSAVEALTNAASKNKTISTIQATTEKLGVKQSLGSLVGQFAGLFKK
jgi:hypothetical protein